ncbi:putative lipoprotein [Corallococcus macrosporus]|nr:putative lipoprotein [Corallococcus macrosporus]
MLLGTLGGCAPSSAGDAVSTVITDTLVGAPVGVTVRVAAGTATLAAGSWCEAAPGTCAELAHTVLALRPAVLTEPLWRMAAEHTRGKRKSTWDKHTKTRAGGKEKKDGRMRFSHGEDDNGKAKKEAAQRKKEEEKRKKEEARLKKEEARIQREADKRNKEAKRK